MFGVTNQLLKAEVWRSSAQKKKSFILARMPYHWVSSSKTGIFTNPYHFQEMHINLGALRMLGACIPASNRKSAEGKIFSYNQLLAMLKT